MAYASWSVVFGEQPSAAKWNILGTNDASFNDGTGIAVSAITPEKLLTGTGTSWTYTSYSPTYTNVTVGNGSTVAYYKQIGKMVHYWGIFTFGSTSAMGSGPTISLPVNLNSNFITTDNYDIGTAHLQDDGTGAYPGSVRIDSSTAISLMAWAAGGSYVSQSTPTSTVPFTWGTNDSFSWNITYPAS